MLYRLFLHRFYPILQQWQHSLFLTLIRPILVHTARTHSTCRSSEQELVPFRNYPCSEPISIQLASHLLPLFIRVIIQCLTTAQ